MAEFAIATGIVQVAGAGVALTKALYNFGATTSSAGEQTDFIGKNITLYCRVLKTLGQQLKVKEPDHTIEALEVAREIHEQSNSLFQKIWNLLPAADRDGCGLSLKQKILWNFRRNRVDYLVGQLEYLKSTVSLLLHVLASVPRLRKYRRSKKKSGREKEELSSRLQEQQNLLYERCQAQRQLQGLADRANRDSIPLLNPAESIDLSLTHIDESSQGTASRTGPTLAQIDAYTSGLSTSSERALILQKTTSWLAQLYAHWTTLSDGRDGPDHAFDEVDVANLTASTAQSSAPQVTATQPNNGDATHDVESTRVTQMVRSPDIGISLEYQPHTREGSGGCECVRARMQPSREFDELIGISSRLQDLLILCQANKNLSQHAKNLLQLSARRKELDQLYQERCILPLIRACRGKLSEFLAQTDIQIAELCDQRVEAMAEDAWEKCDAIKQEALPLLMRKRIFLAECLSTEPDIFIFVQDDGSITASPLHCNHNFQDIWSRRIQQAEIRSHRNYSKNITDIPASLLNGLGIDTTVRSARPTSEQKSRSSRRDFGPETVPNEEHPDRSFGAIPSRKSALKTKASAARSTTKQRRARVDSDTDNNFNATLHQRKDKKINSEIDDFFLEDWMFESASTVKEVPETIPLPTMKIEDPIADGVDPDPFGQSKFWTSSGTLLNDGHKFTTIDEAMKRRHER